MRDIRIVAYSGGPWQFCVRPGPGETALLESGTVDANNDIGPEEVGQLSPNVLFVRGDGHVVYPIRVVNSSYVVTETFNFLNVRALDGEVYFVVTGCTLYEFTVSETGKTRRRVGAVGAAAVPGARTFATVLEMQR
jgi:hypothetical protein